MNDTLLALAPSLLIVPAMGLLSRVRSSSPIVRELRRKALHVGVGLTSLSFPWLLGNPVLVICAFALVTAWMFGVRRNPYLARRFGRCLSGTRRVSHGELYFAIALGVLLLCTRPGSPAYVVPVLVLTLSDTAAALVGRMKPVGAYRLFGQTKTLSGSLAFLVSAFLLTFGVLQFAGTTAAVAAVVAIAVAVTTAVAEAASPRGLDNLTVPAVAFLVIRFLMEGA